MQVPSLSFARNKAHFFKHDGTGITSYLEAVKSDEMTISGAVLLPHKLVYEAIATDRVLARYSIAALEGLNMQSRVDPHVKKENFKLLRGFERKWIIDPSRRPEGAVKGKMSSGERNRVRCTLPISETLAQFDILGHHIGHLHANTVSRIGQKQGAPPQARRTCATHLLPPSCTVG